MKTPQLSAFVGAALLCLAIVLGELLSGEGGVTAVTLLTGAGSAWFGAALWFRRTDGPRAISLGVVFCLYYAISYGFAVLGAPAPFAERLFPFGLGGVDLVALPVGILAWVVGYEFVRAPVLARGAGRLFLPPTTVAPVMPGTLLALFLTTVLVRLYLVVSGGGLGYLRDAVAVTTTANSVGQYLAAYGELGVVVLGLSIVASRRAETHREGYRRLYWLIIPVEFALRLLAGNKTGPLLVVLVVVLSLAAVGGLRLSARRLVVLGAVAVLVIFPFVGTYRDVLRPETGRQLSPTEAPGAVLTAVGITASAASDGPIAYGRLAFDQTAGRLREIDRAAVSIQAHDAGKPFSPATEMPERVATGLVPRVLWPGKPLNLYALDVSRNYYGLSSSVISASSLSPVGDAYRYGGLPMVGVAMVALGAFVRFLDGMLDPRRSIWLLPLLIAAIPLIRGGDLAGLVVATVRYFVVAAVFYRFLFVRDHRAALGQSGHAGAATAAGGRTRS